jgi:hypothetical protein
VAFRTSRLLALFVATAWMTSAAVAQHLPGNSADLKFDKTERKLDLEDRSLEFHYKAGKHQGSSVGFHISKPGHRKSATFAPQNTSSNLESEVVAYRLARFLGTSDIYNPVTYATLGPVATARFKEMLKKRPESDPDRRQNKSGTLAALSAYPTSLPGIYRLRPHGDKFRVAQLGTPEGHLNTSHPLSGFIRANGPVPGDKPMSLAGVKGARGEYPRKPVEKESELARQLSNILLVDQLLGQWDRFVNNLEAFGDEKGRLQFVARDNGGGTVDDWEWYGLYEKWLSRYDRDVTSRLAELHAFLQGKAKTFAGFDDVEAWKKAVGFIRQSSFDTFKRKLDLLIAKRLPALEKQYGERTYFALPPMTAVWAERAAADAAASAQAAGNAETATSATAAPLASEAPPGQPKSSKKAKPKI